MANSGFGVGMSRDPQHPANWYIRHVERKDKFLAEHPEWSIVFVRWLDSYEASRGDKDAPEGLSIVHDKSLGTLMDKLEALYPEAPEADRYQEIQVKPNDA